MVHSGCHAVGMVTSLFRRCYNRRRGYEPIPRCEAEEEKRESCRKGAQKELCEKEEEEDDKKELYEEEEVWKKLKEEGESHEACGDRLSARFRSHPDPGTSFAAYRDAHYAAYFYAQAGSWRKAALAYRELAAYCLKTGRELSAGSALLRSAKCYAEVEDKSLEEVVATKLALDEALALLVKKNDLWLAATACSELAEFHMEHNELHSALVFYQRAAGYHGIRKPGSARDCMFRADHVRFLLANHETLRAKGDLPLANYKSKSTGYMKPTDPDWGQRLGRMLSSTSIAHDRYYFLGLERLLYVSFLTTLSPPALKKHDVTVQCGL